MPTYDYKCDACGTQFEKFQSIKADPIKRCPHCGKNKVQRLISAGAGLIFKGSGFYITDYRSDSYKESAKSDAPATTASGEAGGAGSDSKKTDAAPVAAGKSGAAGSPTGAAGPAKPATPAPPPAEKPAARSSSKKRSR
jgi:putative FmdB family regulatory protein